MPWSGGNYTKGNSATGGWAGDQTLGIGIEAGRHDTQDNDFATGIDQCLNKDGSNAATGNLNFGNFRPTNINAGTAAAPAICAGNDVNTGVFGPAADTWAVATNGSERLRISSTGNAGIGGTTLPTRLLIAGAGQTGGITDAGDKSAAIRVAASGGSSNDGGQIEFGFGYGSYTQSYFAAIKGLGQSGTSNTTGDLAVYTRNATGDSSLTERIRLTNEGRVAIGTTSISATLDVWNTERNDIATQRLYSTIAGDVGTPAQTIIKKDNNSTTSQVFVQFVMNEGFNPSGQINANGASQAAFGSYSDERLKDNIVNLPSQLTNIFALRPVEFDYKDGSGHQIGFIAQEVQEIYPDLVGEGNDGFLTLSGLGKNEARMIKAFQEFAESTQATISALEARIAALEGA
jgi:hypothetical protein